MPRSRAPRLLQVLLAASALCACAGPGVRKGAVPGGRLVRTARSLIGRPYRFGGRSPETGFDCSGLAWWVHRRSGIRIPRSSYAQFKRGRRVGADELAPGDLLFFTTYKKGASHVGIYAGKGRFIHAPSSGKTVRESRISNPYWKKRYLGARRFR